MDFLASSAQTVVSFVVLLLILIFVHELGHFIAAKLLGVKVERFSLGFPPKAFSKTIGETEYQLAWLPLGGYVKMYGEDPDSEESVTRELRHRSFSHKPPWAKMIIVLAGPLANLIFAVLLFWGLSFSSGIGHFPPLVGPVAPGGPAALAGLETGDRITFAGGEPVKYFDDLEAAIAAGGGAAIDIRYKRPGQPEERTLLAPVRKSGQNVFGDAIDFYDAGLSPLIPPVAETALSGSPAAKAGILPGDRIVAIEGAPMRTWEDVLTAIQGPPDAREALEPPPLRPLEIEIERDGSSMSFAVTPKLNIGQNLSGQNTYTPMVGLTPRAEVLIEEVGLFRALAMGVHDAANLAEMTVVGLGKMLSGQISAKTLGGPLLIAEVSGESARKGLAALLRLAAFISINLGILNLLPIPILDGGQFVFFILEAARGKPLSLRVREMGQWIGMGFLGLLMVTVFYNDIARLVTRFTAQSRVEEAARE